MPEPTNIGGEENTPQPDQFGVTLDSEGTEVTQEEVTKTEDKEDKTDKKEDKDSPTVIELRTKLDEYSKNLSGQNDVITKLQNKIAVMESGSGKTGDDKGENENALFKDIKTSKDLTEDERDDMTDTEIALFDRNASLETAMNKMFETISAGSNQKVEDLNTSARGEATKLADEAIKSNPELAKDAKELSDKIIVEFNEFNNEGISPEKLTERMKKALNNVSGYTPPKEQEKKGGTGNKSVKDEAGGGSDPFGVDKIIAGANQKNDGGYSL